MKWFLIFFLVGCATTEPAAPSAIKYVAEDIYEAPDCSKETLHAAHTYYINSVVVIGNQNDREDLDIKRDGFSYLYARDIKEAVAGLFSKAKPILIRCNHCGHVLIAYQKITRRDWSYLSAIKHLSKEELSELKKLLK